MDKVIAMSADDFTVSDTDDTATSTLTTITESLMEYVQTLGYSTRRSSQYQPYTILIYYIHGGAKCPECDMESGYSDSYFASIHCNSENIIVHTYERLILNYEDPRLLDQLAQCLTVGYPIWHQSSNNQSS